MILLFLPPELTDGVTGNTSVFGTEESRFEPWSVNQLNPRNESFGDFF